MFVTVRYGEDQSKIFNADCKNEILLENMKQQCECGEKDVVEVSDERGVVKNLRNFPTEYGSDFLKERETLVLLTVDNGTTGSDDKPVFTPLLASLRNDREFNDTLNRERELDQLLDSSRRQLSSEGDDDVFSRSIKGKSKSNNNHNNNNNNNTGAGPKKSILRRSTKTSLRK